VCDQSADVPHNVFMFYFNIIILYDIRYEHYHITCDNNVVEAHIFWKSVLLGSNICPETVHGDRSSLNMQVL
jgi:hypothetical protein